MDRERGAHDYAQVGLGGEVAVVEEGRGKLFAKEDDFRLDQAIALGVEAARHRLVLDGVVHALLGIRLLAVDATLSGKCISSKSIPQLYASSFLRRKAAVCLYNLVARHARLALETINILREQLEQQSLLMQQVCKRVRNRRPELARIQFLRECVKRLGVVAEEGNVEDGLWVGQIEPREIGIQPRVRRAEIGYPR